MKHQKRLTTLLFVLMAGLCHQHATAQLFTDSFDTAGSAANWHIAEASANSIPDFTAEFGFDYSSQSFVRNGVTDTIPASPDGGGTSLGVKLTVNNNDETPAAAAVSLYAADQNFGGNYALRMDMWMNYNGPEFGGSGSTEFGTFGLNHTATNIATWSGDTVPSSGIWFAVSGEGGAARDYRAYIGDSFLGGPSIELLDPTGGFLDRDGDGENEFDILIDNSQPPTHPLKLMFPKPDFETAGMPSKQWVQVEVRQSTNEFGTLSYTWLINGYVIAEHQFNDGQVEGTVMIGHMDPFSSIANPREQNFVIFDNLRVVDLDVVGLPPVVSIMATQPNAAEPSTDGLITLSRTGVTSSPLTVDFRMTGTATRGDDYVIETNGVAVADSSVVIPTGASSVDVTVKVVDDALGEAVEEAVMVLAGRPEDYDVRESLFAIVEIADDSDMPTASVTAPKAFAYEPNSVNPARFEVMLSNPSFQNVTVNFSVSGTGVAGTDYTALPSSVTINAGETNAVIPVSPIDNSDVDGDRTVVLTLAAGSGYVLDTGTESSVTIRDDDTLPSGTELFAESFDSETSANDWTVNIQENRTDHTATFGYDYSLDGIPAAPNSGGMTRGLKLTANELNGTFGGLSASPTGGDFSGDYILRFDMWINYNGPLPSGGAGSSEFGGGGVVTSGTLPEFAGSGDGLFFAAVGDGGFSQDFRTYFQGAAQHIGAANVDYPGGSQNNTHAYYSIFGGESAPETQQLASPDTQTGLTASGNAGFAWRDMVIIKQGTVVRWFMDNLHIATYDLTTNVVSTNISLVYWDPASSSSPLPQFSFGLFDNVRVQALAPSSQPVITAIRIIDGTTVQIDFTGETGDGTGSFVLQSAGAVDTAYGDVPATITELAPSSFRAEIALSGDLQFYRLRRN